MNFQNLKLTANGKSMLAKVATGGQVIFTKIAFGSGTTSKDVTTLTELVTKKQEFTIASKVIGANGLLTLSCVWNNKDLTTGYYVNELGIYAKPSSSASEVLFAYGTDDSPSFIPEYGGSNVTSGIMKINLIYSSDANVTVQLEYGDKIVEVHNTDPDAHKTLFDAVNKTITDHVNSINPHEDIFAKYVKKAGDTMTGNLTVPKVIGDLQGKADTAGLADKAGTLVGDAGFWNYLHRKGMNFAPPTANTALNALGMFISSYNKASTFKNQPGQYGQLVNIPYGKDNNEATQFWIEQYSGRLYHRGGNGSSAVNDTPFTRFLDTKDLSSMGVVAGNVSNANAWWVKLGGTIPLIIQGGKYFSLNFSSAGSSEKCTLPIAFSKPLFATAISDSGNDDIIPHILGMATNAITVSMDQVANGSWKTNIYLLAIGTC